MASFRQYIYEKSKKNPKISERRSAKVGTIKLNK